jgi:hypothetical protein
VEKSPCALVTALGSLSIGHVTATLLMLLPVALLIALAEWQRPIQASAALIVIGFGVFRLLNRRHPRALARVPPTQLGPW